jgi:hypothetical protein
MAKVRVPFQQDDFDLLKLFLQPMRRDGRVAEGARLESVYTLTGIGGSNPSLSAMLCLPQYKGAE